MKNLHDIKPVEIISFGFYEVIFIVFVLLVVIIVCFGFYKYFFTKKKSLVSKSLVSKDFFQKDSKQLLYDFTIFIKQNKNANLENEFNVILKKIEKYKYCKEQIPLEPEVIDAMKKYIQKLEENVSYK